MKQCNFLTFKKSLKNVLLFIYFILNLFFPSYAAVYYVKKGADDSNDALSWQNAAADLQSAINRAEPGDQVWVATGTYFPSDKRELNEAEYAYASSFILKDGVSIFGGFRGTEESLQERILADENQNNLEESWEFAFPTILTVNEEYPGQVIFAGNEKFQNITIIDGFTISGGRAVGTEIDAEGGGAFLAGNCLIKNCRIIQNYARRGAGLVLLDNAEAHNCLIQANELFVDGWYGEGAGVILAGVEAKLNACLIIENGLLSKAAKLGAAGVLIENGTVDFCTICQNFSTAEGSAVKLSNSNDAVLKNSVIWGNTGNSQQVFAKTEQVKNCAIENTYFNDKNICLESSNNSGFSAEKNHNTVDANYVCFVNPDSANYRLAAGSYLLNRAEYASNNDAAMRQNNYKPYSDIGCYQENLKGNLSADFMLEMPLLYNKTKNICAYTGKQSPENAKIQISVQENKAELEEISQFYYLIKALESGVLELQLTMNADSAEEEFWNEFILHRSLEVKALPLVLKADDIVWQWGTNEPTLTWQIVFGEILPGDFVTGELQPPEIDGIGDYQINAGSLKVCSKNGNEDYALQVLPGTLSCIKGNAQIIAQNQQQTYNAVPQEFFFQTEPEGLNTKISYQGIEGTDYSTQENPPINAGKYRVTINAEDDLYQASANAILEIIPAPLYCTVKEHERDYGCPNPPFIIEYSGFLGNDCEDDIVPPEAYTDAEINSPVTAEGYEIFLVGGSAQNYELILQNSRLIIKKLQTLHNQPLLSEGVYGMPLSNIMIMAYAISPLDGSYIPGEFIWQNPQQILEAGLWNCDWIFIPNDDHLYEGFSGNSIVSIAKREIHISAKTQNKIYGNSEPDLQYEISAGSLYANDKIYGALQRETGENVGTYRITKGNIEISENYKIVFFENYFEILPRQLIVKALDCSKYAGEEDPQLKWTLLKGEIVQEDHYSGELQREPGEELGEYQIKQGELQFNSNYQIDFEAGTLTIKAAYQLLNEIEIEEICYGEELSGKLINAEVIDQASGEIVEGEFLFVEEGTYPESGTLLAEWYFLPDEDQGRPVLKGEIEIIIQKAQLTVSLNEAFMQRKYAENNPIFELQYDGFYFDDDEDELLELPQIYCEADKFSLPGNYEISISGGLADNYELICLPGVLQIKALEIQVFAENQQKEYAEEDPVFTFNYTGELLENDYFAGTLVREAGELPGVYKILQGSLSLPSYYQITYNEAVINIGKIQITVAALNHSVQYGETIPELTYALIAGTMLEEDKFYGSLKIENFQNAIGTYTITQGTLHAAEYYNLSFVTATFTIVPRKITIKALDASKYFGVNDPQKFNWQIIEGTLLSNDQIIGELQREAGEDFGTYRILQGTLTTTTEQCYQINFIEGTFTIGKVRTRVVAYARDILIHGDKLENSRIAFSAFDTRTDTRIDGNCYWTDETERMPFGVHSRQVVFVPENQEIFDESFNIINIHVAKRKLKIYANEQEIFYGEEVPELSWTVEDNYQLMSGEEFIGKLALRSVADETEIEDFILLPAADYWISSGTLDIANSEGYLITFYEKLLKVKKRPITVKAINKNKYLGAADPVLQYEVVQGSLLENDQFSGNIQREVGEEPGQYPITQGSLTVNENYDLNFIEAVLTIMPPPPQQQTRGHTNFAYTEAIQEEWNDQKLSDFAMLPAEEPSETQTLTDGIEDDNETLQKTLYIEAIATEKYYSEDDPELKYRVLDADNVPLVLQGRLEREAGENVGKYMIKRGTLHCPNNSKIIFKSAGFKIKEKTILVKAIDTEKFQGDEDPELTWQIEDENLRSLFTGKLSRERGEEQGQYKINSGTLKLLSENYKMQFQPGKFEILAPVYKVIDLNTETLTYGQKLNEANLFGKVIFTDGQEEAQGKFVWQKPEQLFAVGEHFAAWQFIFADEDIMQLSGEALVYVKAKTIAVSGIVQSKKHQEIDPELLYVFPEEEFLDHKTIISGTLEREEGELPGIYKTKLGSLSFGDNYELNFKPGTLFIQADKIIVNENWKVKKRKGEIINFENDSYYFAHNAFSELETALEIAAPQAEILVFPGEYKTTNCFVINKSVKLFAFTKNDDYPLIKSPLIIDEMTKDVQIDGLAFIGEDINSGTLLKIAAQSENISVKNSVFFGKNLLMEVEAVKDLSLKNNIFETMHTCMKIIQHKENQSANIGILLQNNIFRETENAQPDYKHIELYDEKINLNGILQAWNNTFNEEKIVGTENKEKLIKIKEKIVDKENKTKTGKGEVRLGKTE